MTAEKIIVSLTFHYEEADEQKDLFTPAHVLYKCIIKTPNKKQFTFSYQCNPSNGAPTVKDCLYCLLSDGLSYESVLDVDDFLKEFGYCDSLEAVRKGEKIYKACERTQKALERLFTCEELEQLQEFYENY